MDVVSYVLERNGFNKLNPLQEKALPYIFSGKNLVVAAPTASGKTLVAEVMCIDEVVNKRKKVVYIVPLRALASEKYEEFRKKYGKDLRVAISIGDLDSSDEWLDAYDIIIVTSEKLDSLMRHRASWINKLGLVVVDEVHLLQDVERGSNLEIIMTKLMHMVNPRFLCLSATISNHEEISAWIGGESIKSDYRPVELKRGVLFKESIIWEDGSEEKVERSGDSIASIVLSVLRKGKQVLIFSNTRRNTESYAESMGRLVGDFVKNKGALLKVASSILEAIESPTKQCRKLSECIKRGVAFHHAGLNNEQRKVVENAFKEGKVKVLVATPTLAMGVNLPSYMVVIKDLRRFEAHRGMDFISALEVHQMMGRAGRPKYDSFGIALLNAKNEVELEYAQEIYMGADCEKIESKLGYEPVLRMQVLALIAAEVVNKKDSLMEFFSKTFFAHQNGGIYGIAQKIEKVLHLLLRLGFIKGSEGGDFKSAGEIDGEDEILGATKIGKRVAELYIDPLTAHHLIKSIKEMKRKGFHELSVLFALSRCVEMQPLLKVKKREVEELEVEMEKNAGLLYERLPDTFDYEHETFVRAMKTAMLFMEWINEAGEDVLYEKFGVTPGELRARVEILRWLCYSMRELARVLGYRKVEGELKKMEYRISYGVREELVKLVMLKGVGRKRARMLFSHGIKDYSALRRIPLESLGKVIGMETAKKIKEQVSS